SRGDGTHHAGRRRRRRRDAGSELDGVGDDVPVGAGRAERNGGAGGVEVVRPQGIPPVAGLLLVLHDGVDPVGSGNVDRCVGGAVGEAVEVHKHLVRAGGRQRRRELHVVGAGGVVVVEVVWPDESRRSRADGRGYFPVPGDGDVLGVGVIDGDGRRLGCAGDDVGVGRVTGAVGCAHAIEVSRRGRQSLVGEAGGARGGGGDQRQVLRQIGVGGALDLEAGFVGGVVGPRQVDFGAGGDVGDEVARRR